MDEIRPQKGPQENFLASSADIVIFGGAAYGGKSFALLMESTRYIGDSRYNGVIFRRESPQITSGGGLWDTASQIYPTLGGEAKEHKLTYTFPTGSYVKFTHLQHEGDKLNHQGAQYVFIGFDELTHFTEGQFWYLLTRNRPPSGCQKRPYCRCTTNPESDSWVRNLIAWWIDDSTGYAIPERSGVIRYFTRMQDEIVWVDKDWVDKNGNRARSITFIPSYIDDNPLGILADPTYKSNLQAQDQITRERLLMGNWNITYKGGMFSPDWFQFVDSPPPNVEWVRYWDRAATAPKDEDDDPDWTVGALVGMHGGEMYIRDVDRFRVTPAENEKRISDCAKNDGRDVVIGYEVEPGSAGVEVAAYYQTRVLRGHTVMLDRPRGSKVERCKPWCALAEHGHVYLVKNKGWNRVFLAEAGGFPFGKKDQIDAVSGAYKLLTIDKFVWPLYKKSMAVEYSLQWGYSYNIGGIFLAPNNQISVVAALWNRKQRRLYVYGELVCNDIPLQATSRRIWDGMQLEQHAARGIHGNRLLFRDQKKSTADLLNEEMRAIAKTKKINSRTYITEPYDYDMMGSLNIVSMMFSRGMISIHERCQEMSVQCSSWYMDAGKPADRGFELAQALCHIVSELNRTEKLKPPPNSGLPDYPAIEQKQKKRKNMWQSK